MSGNYTQASGLGFAVVAAGIATLDASGTATVQNSAVLVPDFVSVTPNSALGKISGGAEENGVLSFTSSRGAADAGLTLNWAALRFPR